MHPHFFLAQLLCLSTLLVLFVMECYLNVFVYSQEPHIDSTECQDNKSEDLDYKYPLINSMEVAMDYENEYNSSYYWFMAMKHLFLNIGENETIKYPEDTPLCKVDDSSLGPINVIKNETTLEWIEKCNLDVKLGGYYAPTHCRPTYRVAVIVPYRDRKTNLAILLRHIHPILKKQLLEYRIFVIEQVGNEKFNKGILYNIAFLETQRFGTWHCLIFHDVDLIPEDERISYSCPENPTHMSPAVESFDYALPYRSIFGGVTALTPDHYRMVNGYSNFYWDWGAEDDDFYIRLQSKNMSIARHNMTIARYATLPHQRRKTGSARYLLLMLSKIRFKEEGLVTAKYKIVKISQEKLYTHVLADVNPTNLKLNTKSLMKRVISLHGENIMYGQHELDLSYPHRL